MARWLYTLFFYLAMPLILLRLIYRGFRAPRYWQRIPERFGFFKAPPAAPCIWVHAVSVGETIAAVPVIKDLLRRYPGHRILVTTMTPTGSERVANIFGDSVFHVYAPYDLPGSVKRFLARTQPQLLVIMETELWPNMIHYATESGASVLVANARLSERSARGYHKVDNLTASMLKQVTRVAAQHQADAERFQHLGLSADRVAVTGSIKLDISLDENSKKQAAQVKQQLCNDENRFIWIAASTHEGEDEQVLDIHQQLLEQHRDALLILVPRHPERFGRVAGFCEAQFRTVKRSVLKQGNDSSACKDCQVLLGDTMGELLMLYGCADVAFVGGSLVPRGGHNMLEPAAWGIPVLTGQHNYNFEKIAESLQAAGGMKALPNKNALSEELLLLAGSTSRRETMGTAAQAFMASNRGALNKLLALIDNQLTD